MEDQEVHKTPDPSETLVEKQLSTPSTRSKSKTLGSVSKTLGSTDLAWAKFGAHVKGQLWWPARVLDRRGSKVHVSPFGEGHVASSSSAWCKAYEVKPFFCPNLAQMAKQSDSKPFIFAFQEAVKLASKFLQCELTCDCVPFEAKPMVCEGNFDLGIYNLAPLEFFNYVRDAALDVSSMNWGESVRLKSWVFALGQGFCNGNVGFCQRKLMHELVDKLDLDLEISVNENHEEKEEMSKERDVATLKNAILQENVIYNNNINININGSSNSTGKNKKKKRESEKVLERESASTKIKIEEETVYSRRERKKSKYLSPPYTDLPQKIDSSYIMKLNLENSNETNNGDKNNGEKKNTDEANSVNFENLSAMEILTDLLCTGINALYLKSKPSERAIRVFFEKYRDCAFIDGTSYESYKNRIFEQGNENAGSNSGSGLVPGQMRKPDFNLNKCDRKIKEETDLMDSDINIPDLNNKSNEKEKMDIDRPGPSLSVHFEKVITGDDSNKRKKGNKCGGNKNKNSSENNATNNNNHYNLNGVTMLNFGEISYRFTEESRAETETQNGNNPAGISNQLSEQRKRRNNTENNTNGITTPKKKGRKKKVIQNYPNPAALLLDFTNQNPKPQNGSSTSTSTSTSTGTDFPSRELLLSTFSQFGSLIETETELHQNPCTARVVFASYTDAVTAFKNPDKLGPFGPPFATCRFHYLPPINIPQTPPPAQQVPGQQAPAQREVVKAPPLIDIRRNLEKMISALRSGAGERAPIVKVESNERENLMGEMQGLLSKVEKLLANGAASSGSGISSVLPPC